MAERKWTEAQLDAINREGKNILVSAAAGSGKTAVLTRRIIGKLTSPDSPADISKMLVVTFTKAAASELKERISSALSDAIADNPGDRRLQRQFVLLQKAQISTIHGFCLDLIKKNFDRLGISPSSKVSDEAQTSLMKQQTADNVIDNYYSGLPGYDDIENFADFADNFISLKDDRLSSILISVYDRVSSFPQGIGFLSDSAKELEKVADGGINGTVFGRLIKEHMTGLFSYYRDVFSDACEYFRDGDVFENKYLPAFEYEYGFVSSLLAAAEAGDTEKVGDIIAYRSPVKLGAVKKELQTEESSFYREARESFTKNALNRLTEQFLSQNDETVRKTARKTHDFVYKLYLFLSAFDRLFSAEKRKRDLLDYNDLERFAYDLLVGADGMPTETAKEISRGYDDIYIDEYQDVNRVQDAIFAAISSESSRFMVGDIKQSIYGFRGAEPSIFAGYRLNGEIDKIYLRHNFRCDAPIIDFVNLVCGTLFTSAGKTVPYDETDALVCGKAESGNAPVEIAVVDTGDFRAQGRRATEADFVADRIGRLIAEGYRPGDICILLRSASRAAAMYEDALSARGIICRNQLKRDLFVNPEVLLVMDILNVIDNPSRDIYLAGALKSPVFDFSLSELVRIRKCSEGGSLYSALKKYAGTNEAGAAKCRNFLDRLEAYRKLAAEPVDRLIWAIYCDTHIFALATGSDGEQDKKANLLMLYDYARKFESGSYRGLYNFIRYINDVLESGAGFEAAASESDNAVRIMTIHQSKGLEFPVVFLSDCGSAFSDADIKDRVLINRDFGTTMKLSDETGLASYDTVMRRAEAVGIKQISCDEEMRVLYVALTRAIKKLIVTAADTDPDTLISSSKMKARFGRSGNGYAYRTADSYISWILMAAHGYSVNVIHPEDNGEARELSETADIVPAFSPDEVSALAERFRERFSFVYPGAGQNIPAKLSVSELYPEVLDDYADAAKYSPDGADRMKMPAFVSEASATAADIGTATHQFMQFCDFGLLGGKGVDSEIVRLTSHGFIDAHTASLADRAAITRFTETPLFPALRDAEFIRRELRFNIRLPAGMFTADPLMRAALSDETVLVQGIMDCVFTDGNGKLTVLDYKTDRIPYELRHDRCAAREYIINRHIGQLSYYRLACREMMQRDVDRVLIYSFSLSEAIEIPKERFTEA